MRQSSFLCVLLSLFFSISAVRAQDPFAQHIRPTDPLTPEEELASFETLPGLKVALIASEPTILKPLNLAFDSRGRLWITCTREYPYPAELGQGRDQIVILEDRDNDGSFETSTVFADDLNIPIGLLPYKDGCIVFDIPNIRYLADTDGDGKYDRSEKLYGPFDYSRDTHGLNNSFRRGLDGWIYACHGFNNRSRVKGSDGHEITLNSGNTYRFQPDGSRIEHYSHGQVNPYGMAMDWWFDIFTADCHSKPLTQVVRDAYYPSFGAPSDGLGFAPSMMEHLHGSTAIAGVSFLEGHWPGDLAGQLVSGNVMTSRVNRNRIERNGATAIAIEQPDLLKTSDPWFRPVDIVTGPDGSIYIADFYNRIIGHYEVPLEHPGRDRLSGRLWRIRPVDAPGSLISDSHWLRQFNQWLDEGKTPPQIGAEIPATVAEDRRELMLLWALVRTNPDELFFSELKPYSESGSPLVRAHLQRVMAETMPLVAESEQVQPAERLGQIPLSRREYTSLIATGLRDADERVVQAAVDAASRFTSMEFLPILLQLANAQDPVLAYQAKIAIKHHLQSPEAVSPSVIAAAAPASVWKWVREQSSDQQSLLCEICLAVPGSNGAKFVFEHLDRLAGSPRRGEYLSYLTTNLNSDRLNQLIDRLAPMKGRSSAEELALLNSLADGIKRSGSKYPPTLQAWANRVAQGLLERADQSVNGWKSLSLELSTQPTPATDAWQIQIRPTNDGQTLPMISSLPAGEQRTGVLESPEFQLGQKMQFYLAGHCGFPQEHAHQRNKVELVLSEGPILQTVYPPRHDPATLVIWDTSHWAGQKAHLRISDGDTANAFAWLAVGGFEITTTDESGAVGNRPTPVTPSLLPADSLQALEQVESLAREFQLHDALAPTLYNISLERNFQPRYRLKRKSLAASAAGKPFLSSFARLMEQANLADRAYQPVIDLVDQWDLWNVEQQIESLTGWVDQAPMEQQKLLVQSSLEQKEMFAIVLQMIRDGKLSATALAAPGLVEAVELRYPEQLAEIQSLIAVLPPQDAAWRQEVQNRATQYRRWVDQLQQGVSLAVDSASASDSGSPKSSQQWLMAGKATFEKQCAACHQIAGKGQVVGPQLDGIGQRGLERVLEDVLLPNANVDHAFRRTLLQLADGRVVSGLVKERNDQSLVLTDPEGKVMTISLEDVDGEKESPLSLMPEEIARALKAPESFGLVYFLLNQKNKPAQ